MNGDCLDCWTNMRGAVGAATRQWANVEVEVEMESLRWGGARWKLVLGRPLSLYFT